MTAIPNPDASDDNTCPVCDDRYVTAMHQTGPGSTFSPSEKVRVCIEGGWVYLHEGDVSVDELNGWSISYYTEGIDEAAFLVPPEKLTESDQR